jgi:hypothetical protein
MVNDYDGYTFWRRRHVTTKKTPVEVVISKPIRPVTPVTSPVTIVKFRYPDSKPRNSKQPRYHTERLVQLISLSDNYLTGLEIKSVNGKLNYQFKKFCRDKIGFDEIFLESYVKPLS